MILQLIRIIGRTSTHKDLQLEITVNLKTSDVKEFNTEPTFLGPYYKF
jgi:hypothetical protein